MNILVTGGGGFLGARVARALLGLAASGPGASPDAGSRGRFSLRGQPARPVEQLVLTDLGDCPPDLLADPRVRFVRGDLLELLRAQQLPASGTEAVFHLAAAVSAECEADFDLGMRSNLDTTRALLEACRALGNRPTFVYASSLAIFGRRPGGPALGTVDDFTLPTPQGSYGIQKFIGEQLVADYTRKGFLHGRSVRPVTVMVRAGRPNGAASGFFSSMVREPLAGERARVPVPAGTAAALASPASTVAGFLRAAEASDADWGPPTGINLPALHDTVAGIAQALERLAGPAATALLDWEPDPAVERLVLGWPGTVAWDRARGLGLAADPDVESIIRRYAADHPQAIRLPLQPPR